MLTYGAGFGNGVSIIRNMQQKTIGNLFNEKAIAFELKHTCENPCLLKEVILDYRAHFNLLKSWINNNEL